MQTKGTKVIPILYNNCEWSELELSKLQALPRNKNFISNWPNPDAAYTEISKEIGALVKSQGEESKPYTNTNNEKLSKNIDFSQLRMTIAEGYLEKALDELMEYTEGSSYHNEAIGLKSRFVTNRRGVLSNIIAPEVAERTQSQIRHSALELIQILEKQ